MAATSGDPRIGSTGSGMRSTRKFPTGGQYVEALQNTLVCFRDRELKSGAVKRDPVLGPKPISGNFASVFSVTSQSGRRYAVKCFTQDVAAQESRYDAISRHLAALDGTSLSQPWNISFEYQPQGVLVFGEWYPMLKMEWVEGSGLIRWIEDHRADPSMFSSLAARFAALTADLAVTGVAHGDLQHGNLLVAGDGTFRLVDYDGMFVPALATYRATEKGHRNYQSPNRSDDDFGPALDRFSTWVIYLSLIALSIDPSLWDQLHEPDGEFLLLTEEDFQDPSASLRFGTLLSHPDRGLRDLAGRVRDLSSQPLSALPALSQRTFQSAANSTGAKPPASGAATTSASQPSGPRSLPSWLADHLQQPGPVAAAATVPAASGPSGFHRRRPADVALAVFTVLLLVAPASLVVASLLTASALPAAQGGATLTALVAGGIGRRTRLEVRVAQTRRRDLRRQARALDNPAKALVKLDREAQALEKREKDRDTKDSARIQHLQAEQHKEAARINVALNQRLTTIDRELADLPRQEQKRRDEALALLQRSHIQDRLRRTSIQEAAKLSNMGAKTIDALIASGIRTAADFTSVRYVTGGGYGNVTAFFVLSSGYETRVPSVGEKRARALESWRQGIESRARQTSPAKLSPPEQRVLTDRAAADRARLQGDRKTAEADAQTNRNQLQQRIAAERRVLVDAQTAARAEAVRHRAEISQRRAKLTMLQGDRARIDAALAGERQTRRSLAHRRYLKFLIFGR
ncbi:hypothetical protein RKE29_25015 [Streptomyces sp. B1866]|uniref:hypothetical protein n=1 Tax=Streptomyces sp. B1866 TaxID=3075431 RepID=UPI00288F94AE|nr:hypothetical protein [Streptomyces sp. B1866]MDT3399858.1 hypothetical protein [Streptomyces sp. B1866]